jgi:hypothetical protein
MVRHARYLTVALQDVDMDCLPDAEPPYSDAMPAVMHENHTNDLPPKFHGDDMGCPDN